MKVGVLYYYRVGGSGNVAYELAMGLSKLYNVEIHFIGLRPPFRFQSELENPKIHFHEIYIEDYPVFEYPPYTIALASKLVDIIDEEGLDIIHAHYALPHAISAILAKDMAKRKVKVITTLHGTDVTLIGRKLEMRNMVRYAVEKSDVVTAVSHFLKQETLNILGVCSSQIIPIHNFIDLESDCGHVEHFRSKAKFTVTHISNFREVKRPLDVLDIFEKFIQLVGDDSVILRLIGDGPLLDVVKHEVKQRNLCDRVEFLGVKLEVNCYLKTSDMFLLTSHGESFGLVLLEAMKNGCLPVACASGGVVEVIEDGKTGVLYAEGDLDGASKRMYELYKDKPKRDEMIERGYRSLEERFSLEKQVTEYYEVYKRSLISDK